MTSSTPKYVPPHRRHEATPSSQQYLNYEDLHTRYSPPNSPLRMPRIQRSLSINDLRHRFKQEDDLPESLQREQDSSQGQNSPGLPPPSPPPPLPRDFEALRAHGQRFKREQDSSQGQDSPSSPPLPPLRGPASPPMQRPFLSPRFPDPPIFNGSGTGILFEDWKLRIQDKLVINKDHYPSEHSQIAYIITRLGGKAIEHTLPKRRTNSYHSVGQLLDQLIDVYELPLRVENTVHQEAFKILEQGDRPFPEFYSDFIKHVPFINQDLVELHLHNKVNDKLRDTMINLVDHSLPVLRDKLIILDHIFRASAARKAKRKADRFTKQLALASIESKRKKPGKYSIITRPDPDFRR